MGGDGGARTELGLRAGARLAMRQEERVALGGTARGGGGGRGGGVAWGGRGGGGGGGGGPAPTSVAWQPLALLFAAGLSGRVPPEKPHHPPTAAVVELGNRFLVGVMNVPQSWWDSHTIPRTC